MNLPPDLRRIVLARATQAQRGGSVLEPDPAPARTERGQGPRGQRKRRLLLQRGQAQADGSVQAVLGCQTLSEANRRDHWTVKAARAKNQQAEVHVALAYTPMPPEPWRVTLTRISPGPQTLDDDNLRSAFKAIRDQVAHRLGVNDADLDRCQWGYGQEQGTGWGVRIVISTRKDRVEA